MATTDRRSARRFPARSLVIASLLALAFVVSACATASAPQAGAGKDLGGLPVEQPGDGSGSGEQPASLADRKIIRTGEISIEVPNVAAAVGRVRALALELGGYVGSSESGTLGQSATLTLRIPADRFEDALARLHKLDGDVLNEATREEDVTTAVVDLEARLKNLQASEVQYRALLTQAVKIEDILSVQTRLDDVRGQIEQLQAQDKELTGLADLATLTVTLVPGAVQQAAGNWDPGKTVTDAFAALVGFGQNLGNAAIWLAIVVLPAVVVLAILGWLLLRFLPALRRRLRPTSKE
jgi:predicted small secreted protein